MTEDVMTMTALECLEELDRQGIITEVIADIGQSLDEWSIPAPFISDLIAAWRELRRLRACVSMEGTLRVETEDGGCAQIGDIVGDAEVTEGLFVRLQSWSDSAHHPDMDRLRGHRVRVIIDTLDCEL